MAAAGGQYPRFGFALLVFMLAAPAAGGDGSKEGKGHLAVPFPPLHPPYSIAPVCAATPRRRARKPLFSGCSGASGAGCCIRFRVPTFGALHEYRDRVSFMRRSVGDGVLDVPPLGCSVAAVWGQYPCFGFALLVFMLAAPAAGRDGSKEGKGHLTVPFPPLHPPYSIAPVCAATPRRRARKPLFSGCFGASGAGCCIRFRVPAFGAFHECRDRVSFARRSVLRRPVVFRGTPPHRITPHAVEKPRGIWFYAPTFGALQGCRDRVSFVHRSVGAALVAVRLARWGQYPRFGFVRMGLQVPASCVFRISRGCSRRLL